MAPPTSILFLSPSLLLLLLLLFLVSPPLLHLTSALTIPLPDHLPELKYFPPETGNCSNNDYGEEDEKNDEKNEVDERSGAPTARLVDVVAGYCHKHGLSSVECMGVRLEAVVVVAGGASALVQNLPPTPAATT